VATAVHRDLGLARPRAAANLDIVWTVFKARIRIISRYKGALFLEAFLPIVFAALPILIGTAFAGDQAEANFLARTGTTNFRLFMLLGAATFLVVTLMLWLIGFWLRREMETGTLESLYLTPAKKIFVLTGVTTYAFVRSLMAFAIALFLGAWIFGVNPFRGDVLLAFAFLLVGFLPLWGIGFLFGAIIMRIKEANSLINLMQWVVAFLMGIYFPVTVFPPLLRTIVSAFPPTVMTDGVRASLLGLETLFGDVYTSLAVLFAMALITPLLGYQVFRRVEQRTRRKEGMGFY
jgi:ABC-2 type transport system permease protein